MTNTRAVKPTTATLTGSDYDGSDMVAYLKKQISPERLFLVDGEQALRDLGSPRVLNVVLLGAAVRTGVLGLKAEDIEKVMESMIRPQFLELNRKAFLFF